MCISPVDLRRAARTGARNAVRVALQLRRAPAPSRRRPSGTNSCRTPSVASSAAAVVLVPAEQRRRRSRKPRSVRKRSSSSSGLSAGLEPAVDLQDQLLAEDDRAVRLLDADRRARSAASPASGVDAVDARKLNSALLGADRPRSARSAAGARAACAGSAERVVDRPSGRRGRDRVLRRSGRSSAPATPSSSW